MIYWKCHVLLHFWYHWANMFSTSGSLKWRRTNSAGLSADSKSSQRSQQKPLWTGLKMSTVLICAFLLSPKYITLKYGSGYGCPRNHCFVILSSIVGWWTPLVCRIQHLKKSPRYWEICGNLHLVKFLMDRIVEHIIGSIGTCLWIPVMITLVKLCKSGNFYSFKNFEPCCLNVMFYSYM